MRLLTALLMAGICGLVTLPARIFADAPQPDIAQVQTPAPADDPPPKLSQESQPPEGQPPEGPPTEGHAAESHRETQIDMVARRVAEAYRESTFGYSLTLAVASINPELSIHPNTNIGVRVERYEEPGATAFLASLAGPSLDPLTLEITPGLRISPFVLNWTGNYSTFEGQQTIQTTSSGAVGGGRVEGDYLYGAGQLNQWLLWDSTWAPGAFHTWMGWGVGLLRFEGKLDYSVDGTDYAGQISNDGLRPHFVQSFGFEMKVRNFLLAAIGIRMSANGVDPVKARFTVNGRPVGDYYETFESRTFLIGYAIPL